jgi:hypothetical protein
MMGLPSAQPDCMAGTQGRPCIIHRNFQTMYFIISFMSPNSMTVLSSVMTMRP